MKKGKTEPEPRVRLQFTELELISILRTFDDAETANDGKISGTDKEFRYMLIKKIGRRMIIAVKRLKENELRKKQDADKST